MLSQSLPIQSQVLLSLAEGELHIWQVQLRQSSVIKRQLFQYLSDDECMRANRFRFERDRSAYIMGRGMLRQILASYLDIEPSKVEFDYLEFGKPVLRDDPSNLCFNLSHANNIAVFAISRGRNVGIDIEHIRMVPELDQIAQQFFSANEAKLLDSLPPTQKLEAFFNCWTRKESYIKAKGEGLSIPLNQFDVSFLPDESAALLATRDDPREVSRWEMLSFQPEPNYIAALAMEKPIVSITFRQWDHSSNQLPTG